jgi:hypothetical protein
LGELEVRRQKKEGSQEKTLKMEKQKREGKNESQK